MEKSVLPKELGKYLQLAREERNLSREPLAAKAGLSSTFIANLECGNILMSVVTPITLSRTLGVSADTLLYGKTSENQLRNITAMLRDHPADMVRFIEKMTHLSIEFASGSGAETLDDGNPHKEVQPDVSAK